MIKIVKTSFRSGWAPLLLATAIGVASLGGAQADPLRNYGKSLDKSRSMHHGMSMRHMHMMHSRSAMHRMYRMHRMRHGY